jgi:hypothetical protein
MANYCRYGAVAQELNRFSSQHKMQDKRDHREHQQEVNKGSSHMKDREAANPCDQ